MDDLKTLLLNARDRLGCSGLRNLSDLAQMRLETLEKRIAGAQHQLTVRNTLSIYAAWLWKKAFCIVPKDLYLIIEKWCVYLWGIGCTREMARVAWTQAQTMLGPMTAAQIGSLHMKIGSAITNQFPTVSLTKRKHAVLEDTVGPDKQPVVEETNHQNVHLPPTKKHKASHIAKGDEVVVEIPTEDISAAAQVAQSKKPLPVMPNSLLKVNRTAINAPLRQFGALEGVLRAANGETTPQQPCIPMQPQRCSQLYPQRFAQHRAVSSDNSGARIAPYPRMHNSPLDHQSILVPQEGSKKPLIGYHPSVTRLFRRRPNVWVHQTNREVALDTWGDFSDLNQPREYWAWEEYDPFNPTV
ncbi:hypothetical protein V2A60_007573 [Cordyceps javanica]